VLYSALNKLKEKYREAIVLFEISGFTLDEIRDVQGGTLSGVKSRLKRGREMLEKIMLDNYSSKSKKIFSEKKNGKAYSDNTSNILNVNEVTLRSEK
jgi:RNA polymerase sigma-70 factor (ECF subfamily)